jgi:Ca2+-transporting ATPase
MTAVSINLMDDREEMIEVTGAGYAPEGEFKRNSEVHDPQADPHLRLLLTASALCNDAHLQREGERWSVVGDTTEGALLVMALKAGFDRAKLEQDHPRQSEVPFSSERSRMTTVHPDEGGLVAYVKGGVDVLLPLPETGRKCGELT